MVSTSAEARSKLPRLHLVTDDAVLEIPEFTSTAAEILRAFGERVAIHIRGPGTSGAALYNLAATLAPIASRSGATLLVNDRVDVALAVGTTGAQIGARGIPLPDARRLLGPDRWIGASIHSVDEAVGATEADADFLVAGTLYRSESHPGRPGADMGWLSRIVELGRPVIGIGGITPDRVPEVIASGAHGAAVLSGVWYAADPVTAVELYLTRIE